MTLSCLGSSGQQSEKSARQVNFKLSNLKKKNIKKMHARMYALIGIKFCNFLDAS